MDLLYAEFHHFTLLLGIAVEVIKDKVASAYRSRIALQAEVLIPVRNVDFQALLQQTQMLIERTAKRQQPLLIGWAGAEGFFIDCAAQRRPRVVTGWQRQPFGRLRSKASHP